jgi:hypothetical protein
MNFGGFSIWRFLGVSALKSRVSRTIGVPLIRRCNRNPKQNRG